LKITIAFSEFSLFSIAFASVEIDLTLFFRRGPLFPNSAGTDRSKEGKKWSSRVRQNN
jgi:hypothetical protein